MVLVSQYISELRSTSQNKCLNRDMLGGIVQQRKQNIASSHKVLILKF